MPRITKLKPVKVGDGRWRLNIPAEYSNTGKRRRMLFPSEAKAEAEVRRIKGHVSKHVSASTRFLLIIAHGMKGRNCGYPIIPSDQTMKRRLVESLFNMVV